jgi:hypothetical protein
LPIGLILSLKRSEETSAPKLFSSFFWFPKFQRAVQIVVLAAIILTKYAIARLRSCTTDRLHFWIR